MRKLIFLLLLIPCICFGQTPEPVYGDYRYPGNVLFDNGLYFPVRDTVGFAPNRVGAVVILPQDTVGHPATPPVRLWNGNYWISIPGGAGNVYFANNGLKLTGNTFQLGAPLLFDTDIQTGSSRFSLNYGLAGKPIFSLSSGSQVLGFTEADNSLSGFTYSPAGKQGVFRFQTKGVNIGQLGLNRFDLYDSTANNYFSTGVNFTRLTGSAGSLYAEFTPSAVTFLPLANADTLSFLQPDISGRLILKRPSQISAIDSAFYDGPTGTFTFRRTTGAPVIVPTGLVDSIKTRVKYSELGYMDVRWYGAVGDGTTDDLAAIQATINATPENGTVYMPKAPAAYKITAPLVVSKNITIRGDGSYPVLTGIGAYGSAKFNSINAPDSSPYLKGSVIKQVTAGQDIIQITGAGRTVNIYGIGLLFDPSIAFQNTGNGIYYMPPAYSTGKDNGLWGSTWKDIRVFGHDGNHYAVNLTNAIYNDYETVQGFGGGLFRLDNNSSGGNYGNSVFRSCYAQVFDQGAAHGVYITSTSMRSNLFTFIRLQVTVNDMSITYPTATPATSAQRTFLAEGITDHVSILGGDFESGVGSTAKFPYHTMVDAASYVDDAPAKSWHNWWNGNLNVMEDTTYPSVRVGTSTIRDGVFEWSRSDERLEIKTSNFGFPVWVNGTNLSLNSRPESGPIYMGDSVATGIDAKLQVRGGIGNIRDGAGLSLKKATSSGETYMELVNASNSQKGKIGIAGTTDTLGITGSAIKFYSGIVASQNRFKMEAGTPATGKYITAIDNTGTFGWTSPPTLNDIVNTGNVITRDGLAFSLRKATSGGSAYINFLDETGAQVGFLGMFGSTNSFSFFSQPITFSASSFQFSSGNVTIDGSAKINGVQYSSGSGSPEGAVTAPVGSWYSDTTNGLPYFKKTGTGNTGWKQITLNP
ncbi:glycosyl hydrolase family 28-related protein [Chitinophaga sp. 22536]|uniref:glycosyl hydrolase family 28-related protein n=1 Tax=unclassified Chitinophaga TaxID=2619133 RepID=UPI003F8401C9